MNDIILLISVLVGISVLLFFILYLKINSFISLLIASIVVGLIAGMPLENIIINGQKGMGNTLGFVATVIGLGSVFGAILEHSGGATSLSQFFLKKFGEKNAPVAIAFVGFITAIPVFFDVAFIILIPLIYSLSQKTKKSILIFAIPLLSGLAITHTFIPPTPGPIAVAEILNVDLGMVIIAGFIIGIPTLLVSGLWFGNFIGNRIKHTLNYENKNIKTENVNLPSVYMIFFIIGLPLVLIVFNTIFSISYFSNIFSPSFKNISKFIGHPFVALIIANLFAWYFLGIKRGISKSKLSEISLKSFLPVGSIILLTGAGGVFKQILIETGAGQAIANNINSLGFSIFIFAYIIAALIRILQGSASVAMITSAGMVAPLLSEISLTSFSKGLLVIAIASGASIFSHFNDSGFWLVKEYLHLSEKQTLKSWSVMTTLLSLTGIVGVVVLNFLVNI